MPNKSSRQWSHRAWQALRNSGNRNRKAPPRPRILLHLEELESRITPVVASHNHLVFLQQPGNATAGQPIPEFQLAIENQFNSVVQSSTTSVTLTIAPAGAGAPASSFGPFPVTAKPDANGDGFYTFKNLVVDLAGTYTLTASDTSNDPPASPVNPITISPAAPKQIAVNTASQTVTAGLNSSVINLQVTDRFGNPVPDVDVLLSSSADKNDGQTGQFLSADGATNITDVETDSSGAAGFLYTDTLKGTPTLTFTDATDAAVHAALRGDGPDRPKSRSASIPRRLPQG